MYARDISKKRRISNKIKGNAGEPMGLPPYGYMKNPDGSKSWVVDEEAATVVRRIFSMTMDGIGPHQIAGYSRKRKYPYSHKLLAKQRHWQTGCEKHFKLSMEKLNNRFNSDKTRILR